QLVSFQANKNKPGYRWFKYKEGFSEALVQHLLDHLDLDEGRILDPFAGTGTALFVASERGLDATGIELLTVGCEIMEVRKMEQNGDGASRRSRIDRWHLHPPWKQCQSFTPFPRFRISSGAFPDDPQHALARDLAARKSETGAAAQV